jgi:hypothetical protein
MTKNVEFRSTDFSTNRFGDILFEGVTIHVQEDAFAAGEHGMRPYYAAHGLDNEGNEYLVTWLVKDEFVDMDDNGNWFWITLDDDPDYRPQEDQLCDWNEYSVKRL